MELINIMSSKRVAAVAFALIGLASVVGCSSGNDGDDSHPPTVPPPTPTPVVDAFYTTVAALAINSPDDSEAGAIETAVVTAPEESEPQPFG